MRKTRRNRAQTGGLEIGSGGFGLVYKPPLKCDGKNIDKYSEGHVSKIFTYESEDSEIVDTEYQNGLLVKHIDPDGTWSITPELLCNLAKGQTNKNFRKQNMRAFSKQIIYKDGGHTLSSLVSETQSPDIKLYLKAIDITINTILPQLHVAYIHGDLHDENIMYNPSDKTVRLIDFGHLSSIDDYVSREMGLFQNRFGLSDRESLDKVRATFIDDAKMRDYHRLYEYVSEHKNNTWFVKSLPKITAWYEHWDEILKAASQDGSLRCETYHNAFMDLIN